ncbi:MAG TPA: helix-turn-helix domain-containing protein, partial [Acidimicrobiales bacterium]
RTWRQIMSVAGVLKPLSGAARVAANLGAATGSFRRALAKALRAEGMPVNAIADNFGVSRQRVSTLVRPEAATSEAET